MAARSRIKVDPGDHECVTPDVEGEAAVALNKNDGRATWTCAECDSAWHGKTDFNKYGGEWAYRVMWKRVRLSSRRWKKAERRRIEALIEVEA